MFFVSLIFVLQFFLILIIMLYTFFRRGVNFKTGIAFGVLFFIFIPVWIMISTGTLELSRMDFHYTTLPDIIYNESINSSRILIAFLFSIILYLYFPSRYSPNVEASIFRPNFKGYLILYIIGMLIIFIGSGLLDGGDWYQNRESFMQTEGALAVLVVFIVNSVKILIISSLFYKWTIKSISFNKLIFFASSFIIFDMIFSGNRIYLFVTSILIILSFFKRYPKTTLISFPFLLPIIYAFGYFASIFRHIRGPLFSSGLPSYETFTKALTRAMALEPPSIKLFFIGISESINLNLIYSLFNNFNDFLLGATYIKPLFFYVPRSIWGAKPESITVIAADMFGGSSLVTTIIGEIFMNFSFYGLIILPVLLWFTDAFITRSLKPYGLLSSIIGFFFGVLFFRMPFSDEILVFIFLVLILWFFNIFKKYRFIVSRNDNYKK